MRRRLRLALLAAIAVLVAYPAVLVVRGVYFPPRYDVVSIATLPMYHDAALIERGWSLPVATRYQHRVDPQRNVSLCGPTSAANAFRSLGAGPVTAPAVLEGTGRCRWLGYCWNGLTLDELAEVVRSNTQRTVSVIRNLSLDEFRDHMRHANDLDRRYLVNFHRGLLFGKGGGHHSPVGGYLPDQDLVFVLDVNARFGPWLVPTARLYEAVNSVDAESGEYRGLILIH